MTHGNFKFVNAYIYTRDLTLIFLGYFSGLIYFYFMIIQLYTSFINELMKQMRISNSSPFQEAMKKKLLVSCVFPPLQDNRNSIWHPPDSRWLKLNIDASLLSEDSSFTLGMILREDHEHFVRGKTMKIDGSVSIMEAETRGVFEAINWVEALNLHNVSFECDSSVIDKAIKSDMQYCLEIDHIFEICRLKFKQRVDFSLSHVKNQANYVAHNLTRVPFLLNSSIVFLSPPSILLEPICNEFIS